ncbi:hypothetical protein BJX62DRAFT_237112 [Aspergillus germanicus]
MVPNDTHTQAVVFVNDSDELCVVDRTGLVELLQVSPYGKQLEACLVFLDEAHTRGIDLRLPQVYRAAVTPGAGITKDKLAQACMRMRKLGKGQSVVFCIPQEIQTKILSLIGKACQHQITISVVICWSVSETWAEVQNSIPLWAVQGRRFEYQKDLWNEVRGEAEAEIPDDWAEDFLEPESQSLEQRYRPHHPGDSDMDCDVDNENLRLIQNKCQEFSNLTRSSTNLHEEQERQLAPEIVQERQVQRPPRAKPEKHSVHQGVWFFVTTGTLRKQSSAFLPAFEALRNTSAAKFFNLSEFPNTLMVTTDFARTIEMPSGLGVSDSYQRPVEWIVTSHTTDTVNRRTVKYMVIVSPFEANHLHADISESDYTMMHVYAARQNGNFSSLHDLKLYTVPTVSDALDLPISLRIQLNLFAGQLYIASFEEDRQICDFLGIASTIAQRAWLLQRTGSYSAVPEVPPAHSQKAP